MQLRLAQSAKRCGSRAAPRANLIQLTKLAPQHLILEVRRVASRCASRGFERLTEIAKQPLDVVSFDNQGAQLEATLVLQPLLSVAALAMLKIDLERAFEKLSPGAIPRPMRGRMLAVTMRRVRDGFRWRCWHDERA